MKPEQCEDLLVSHQCSLVQGKGYRWGDGRQAGQAGLSEPPAWALSPGMGHLQLSFVPSRHLTPCQTQSRQLLKLSNETWFVGSL